MCVAYYTQKLFFFKQLNLTKISEIVFRDFRECLFSLNNDKKYIKLNPILVVVQLGRIVSENQVY